MKKTQQEKLIEISKLYDDIREKFYQVIRKRPMKSEQVTTSQWKALILLSTKESFKMKDITEDLNIASSSATELIDRLIREQLVERDREAGDRRVVTVKLTDKGRSMIDEFKEIKRKFWTTLAEGLSEEEIEEFLKFSQKFYRVACKMAEEEILL
jgi:DNA-binding MarR family transcriptional regulator